MRSSCKIGTVRIDIHGYKSMVRDEVFGHVRFLYIQMTSPVKGQRGVYNQWTMKWNTPERSKEYHYEKRWTILPTITCSKPLVMPGFRMYFKWLKWEVPLIDIEKGFALDSVQVYDQDARVA